MNTLLQCPFFERLDRAQRVLIAGAGGGFDIYCGLPLFFSLREAGKEVHLANLSFTDLPYTSPKEAVCVTPKTDGPMDYFPERWLSVWLSMQSIDQPVYAFSRTGVRPLVAAYEKLVRELKLDAVVLIDGGTDSLMRGDEVSLGTPEEDFASLAAVSKLDVPEKLLACVGFGIDTFHGVCHAQFLESVAALASDGGHLGTFALLRDAQPVCRYREAVEFASSLYPKAASIVNNSVASAIEGKFGNYHRTRRTSGSELWINPMMNLCWCFDLTAVVDRSLIIPHAMDTETYFDISLVIEKTREQLDNLKPWQQIPV